MNAVHRAVYQAVIRTAGLARSPWGAAAWDRLWALASDRLSGQAQIAIHGRRVVVNAGYAYPAFLRRWPTYNNPLVELVHQAHAAAGSPISVVDVGAAIGDTVLLILERCPEQVKHFDCVEGDPEFVGYLERNLGRVAGVRIHFAMLSDQPGHVPELVRTHPGTASAQGSTGRSAVTLDSLLSRGEAVHVLKIDTDGFDGKVLGGARDLLATHRPAVIFEWHPLLCRATGQDWVRPFAELSGQDYEWFIWFTKEGELSHLDHGYQRESVAALAELCLTGSGPRPDWHYDVVALPRGSAVSPLAVAALHHARSSRR